MLTEKGRHVQVAEKGPRLRQPSRLRLVDDVYHSIEEAILSGQLRPGERLVEPGICAQLGVSRTTVREALLMLQRQGLVDSQPRRGTFVTRLSREEAADLCQTRALLESYAVLVGFARIDPAILAQLGRWLAEMGACRLPTGVPRLLQLDLAFHRLLVEQARSLRLLDLWCGLNGQIRALYLGALERQRANIADVVAMHRHLLDALASGDRDAAVRAVIGHYVRAEADDGQAHGLILAELAALAGHTLDIRDDLDGQRPATANVPTSKKQAQEQGER